MRRHSNRIANTQCALWMPFALIIDTTFAVVIVPAAAASVNREAQSIIIDQNYFLPKLSLTLGPFVNGISIDGAFYDRHEPDNQPDKLEKLYVEYRNIEFVKRDKIQYLLDKD